MELRVGCMPTHVFIFHGNAQPESTLHPRTGLLGGTRLTARVLPSCRKKPSQAPRKPCLCSVRDHVGVQETPGKNVAIQFSKLALRPSNSLALCPKVMLRQHLCLHFDDIFYAYYSKSTTAVAETLCSWRAEYRKRTKAKLALVPKTHTEFHSLSKLCKFSIYSLKAVITTF